MSGSGGGSSTPAPTPTFTFAPNATQPAGGMTAGQTAASAAAADSNKTKVGTAGANQSYTGTVLGQ
jgi:hypothetical protein